MTSITFFDHADTHGARPAAVPVAVRPATRANPIPPGGIAASADLAIRCALALLPFSAIAWTFLAH